MTRRHADAGQVGARPTDDASDTYQRTTRTTPSRVDHIVFPSDRFVGRETITAAEWLRRHTATYERVPA